MFRVVAWLGGGVFVAAMGTFGWFYLVRLGVPAPAGAPLAGAAVVDILLFTTFAAHHSVMARSGAKRWLARRLPPALERAAYVWVASALFIGVCLLWQPLPGVAYRAAGPAAWGLRGLQLLGVLLTWRGAAVIDPLELAGIRQAAGDSRPAAFRVVGPFRWVRHPIYLGWFLMVFGAPVMTMGRLLFAVVSSAYLVAAIPWEERSLAEAYGEAYTRYQRDVRWRVLPGVW
ncbi:MAG: isoprenylcysteine carboxylmethyltransferase family protein [Vicinamibacterales bacterium]